MQGAFKIPNVDSLHIFFPFWILLGHQNSQMDVVSWIDEHVKHLHGAEMLFLILDLSAGYK